MDNVELTLTEKVFGGLFAIILSMIGYFVKGHDGRMKEIEGSILEAAKMEAITKERFAEFQLECERRYAKEESMQSSLARIHDRLDDHASSTDANFKELREGILTIINMEHRRK